MTPQPPDGPLSCRLPGELGVLMRGLAECFRAATAWTGAERTGSAPNMRTIGIVDVAAFAASAGRLNIVSSACSR
jgi:hypothetical protein